jgi:hypothetical protein
MILIKIIALLFLFLALLPFMLPILISFFIGIVLFLLAKSLFDSEE